MEEFHQLQDGQGRCVTRRRQPIFRLMDEPPNVDSPRTQLWRAVLDQVVWDATTPPGEDPDEIKAHEEAKAWLESRGTDFEMVCEYASVEPSAVDKVVKYLNEHQDI